MRLKETHQPLCPQKQKWEVEKHQALQLRQENQALRDELNQYKSGQEEGACVCADAPDYYCPCPPQPQQ